LKITAVVPVYNEEDTIREFATRLLAALDGLPCDYEAVFVVEGQARTLDELTQLSRVNPKVRLTHSERPLGLGRAIRKGLTLVDADSDFVLTMDADLNHQPEEIHRLLGAVGRADVVIGSRRREGRKVWQPSVLRRTCSGLANWALRTLFKVPAEDATSGFRLYSAEVIRGVRDEIGAREFEVTAELLVRAVRRGFRIAEVPITFLPRPRGRSKLSYWRSGIGYARLFLNLTLR